MLTGVVGEGEGRMRKPPL